MTITAGIDLGSTYTKVVLSDDEDNILARAMRPTGFRLTQVGRETFEEALIDGLFGGKSEVTLGSLKRKFFDKVARVNQSPAMVVSQEPAMALCSAMMATIGPYSVVATIDHCLADSSLRCCFAGKRFQNGRSTHCFAHCSRDEPVDCWELPDAQHFWLDFPVGCRCLAWLLDDFVRRQC